jgi:hypothetical protein
VIETDELVLARTLDVEDEDLVLTLLEPATGHVESLLRTDLPEAAEAVAVDIDEALAPGGEVEEGVGLLVYGEGALVVAGDEC